MVNRLRRLLRRRRTLRQSDHGKKDFLEKDIDSNSESSSHSPCPRPFGSRAYDNYATPIDLDMSCRTGTTTVTSSGSRAAVEMAEMAKPQKSTLRPKKDRYRIDLDASTTTASTQKSGSHADGSDLLCPSHATNEFECRLFAAEMSSISSTRATPTRDNRYHQVTFENHHQDTDCPVHIPACSNPDYVQPAAMIPCPFSLPISEAHDCHNHIKRRDRSDLSGRKRDASVILAARRQAILAQAKFYGADHSDVVFAHQQLCNEMASGRLSESVLDSEMQPTGRARQNSIVSRSA